VVTTIGVISNPLSHRNRRGLQAVRDVLAQDGSVLHDEIEDMAALPAALDGFAERAVDLVVVNAGDGTVQAVMTHMLNGGGFGAEPALAVLPAGRTNLIAHGVGLEGRPVDGLARLLARHAAGMALEPVGHAVLSLRLGADAAPIHGMFLGSAAFYHGTMQGRETFHPMGAAGRAVVGLSLGLVVLRALFGANDRIMRGDAMTMDIDGAPGNKQDYFIVLATTLERLMLGLDPFWGDGAGALRFTTARFPPPRLGRALLPLLRGRPRSWMAEAGYASRRVDRLAIRTACPMVFDGQIVTPDPAVPVILGGDRRVAFLRC
jgi:hypothetical protein